MTWLDARVKLVFAPLDAACAGDAVLFEGEIQPWPGATAHFTPSEDHPPGCACCATRSAAGRALAQLLHARARNEVAFFRRVVAVTKTVRGRAEIETALAKDPVVSTCFKKVLLF
jgi:hypothetical protein